MKFTQAREPIRKIKIGVVSADFRDQHPEGVFITPLFGYYDKSMFHFSEYYNRLTKDTSTASLKAMVDDWVDVCVVGLMSVYELKSSMIRLIYWLIYQGKRLNIGCECLSCEQR